MRVLKNGSDLRPAYAVPGIPFYITRAYLYTFWNSRSLVLVCFANPFPSVTLLASGQVTAHRAVTIREFAGFAIYSFPLGGSP